MRTIYQESLTILGITSGFVEKQIEQVYQSLKELYQTENLEFLSPEYLIAIDKKYEIEKAYFCLKEPFSHYVVSGSSSMNEEQMIEEISKMIYDYNKKGQMVDKEFIATLVESLVSFKGLHDYMKDIEFHRYGKSAIADYSKSGTLCVYESNLKNYIFSSEGIDEIQSFPYYCTVSIIRHEIEHAIQRKLVMQRNHDIQSLILQACDTYNQKATHFFSNIVNLPSPLFQILNALFILHMKVQDKKYRKIWPYCPEERLAELYGNSFCLTLINHSQNKDQLQQIQNYFIQSMIQILFFGYDKKLGPTDFYLSKFKQYEDCLKINEISKSLSLEERLLLGLRVTPDELAEAKENKEKVLSVVRKIC